jgi:hypothetical protein
MQPFYDKEETYERYMGILRTLGVNQIGVDTKFPQQENNYYIYYADGTEKEEIDQEDFLFLLELYGVINFDPLMFDFFNILNEKCRTLFEDDKLRMVFDFNTKSDYQLIKRLLKKE